MKTERISRQRERAATLFLRLVLAIAALILIIPAGAEAEEHVLFSFAGANGSGPDGTLVFDSEGNLYGTTLSSTPNANCFSGCGVVFKLTPSPDGAWTETVLYQFMGGDDGFNPYSGVVFDAHGNLYGTTFFGGGTDCIDDYGDKGCGIVYMLSPTGAGDWKETILYRFKGRDDGSGPFAGVIFDAHGALYGTTLNAGNPKCVCGTVFKLTPKPTGAWKKTMLHIFAFGDNEGQNPYGTLVFDKQGRLYGTTYSGGNYGTVFQLTPEGNDGWTFKLIHAFAGNLDGGEPYAGLIPDASGNFYGTTASTAFELTPNRDDTWAETVLHEFNTGLVFPSSPLAFDNDGNLYGTCIYGGSADGGGVFKLTKSTSGTWREEDAIDFSGSNGFAPYYAGLISDSSGNLYGVASAGGSTNHGVVFEITP
jgi:uncharacterized repeat protein (TIGR03803 family)